MPRAHVLLTILVVATLAGGCEQWKAPERVSRLEGRVDELSTTVAAMKDKSGSEDKGAAGEHAPAAPASAPGHAASPSPADPAAATLASAAHGALAATPAAVHAAAPPAAHARPHWSYEGAEGPSAWGKLSAEWAACGQGKAQSPIDIEPKAGRATPIEFSYRPTAAKIVDNGHTLQVNLAPGSSIAIDGHSYGLVQFHVHTPSEHSIAGEHYPMELHLVHKDEAGKLAVVGVMFDVGAESRTLQPVWSRWPKKTGVETELPRPVDPSALLPPARSVYRYPGSLTTPPCSEGVVWNVLRRTMTDSKSNLDILRLRYPHNARPVLPRGDRDVL